MIKSFLNNYLLLKKAYKMLEAEADLLETLKSIGFYQFSLQPIQLSI